MIEQRANLVSVAHRIRYVPLKILEKTKALQMLHIIRKMLELSDSKTEHLSGRFFSFVSSLPVILTQQIAIELGLINGMDGIFWQLVYQACISCRPKLDSIQTYRVSINNILPRDRRTRRNQKASLSVKRRALPPVPAYCITTHKSQGQTLSKVVIDLKLPNEPDDIVAVYVPLSRVKRLADLVILRHFDYTVFVIKPSKSQAAEMERLDEPVFIDSDWFCWLVLMFSLGYTKWRFHIRRPHQPVYYS